MRSSFLKKRGATLLLIWVVFVGGIVSSCDTLSYESSETNREAVNRSVEPDVTLQAQGDTLRGWGTVRIEVDAKPKGGEPADLALFIDGEREGEADGFEAVEFDTYAVDDGAHSFRVVFATNLTEGGLAARLSRDSTRDVASGTIITRDDPPIPTARSLTVEKNFLTFRWERYPRAWPGFEQYNVYRVDDVVRSSFYSPEYELVDTITDPDSTLFRDPSYVGGEATYQVRAVAQGDESDHEGRFSIRRPLPEIQSLNRVSPEKWMLSWSAARVTGPLERYRLQERQASRSSPGGWETIYETESPTDTTAERTRSLFSDRYEYRVVADSTRFPDRSRPTVTARVGASVDWDGLNVYSPVLKSYFSFDPHEGTHGTLSRYDGATKEAEGQLSLPESGLVKRPFFSPDRTRLYQIASRRVHEYDLQSMSLVATHDLSGVIPDPYVLTPQIEGYYSTAAEGKRMVLNLSVPDGRGHLIGVGLLIVDLDPTNVVYLFDGWKGTAPSSEFGLITDASPTGRYFTAAIGSTEFVPKLYRIRPDTIEAVGETLPSNSLFVRSTFPGGGDQFITYADEEIEVRSLPGRSQQRAVNVGSVQKIGFDYVGDTFWADQGDTFSRYDAQGNLIGTREVAPERTYFYQANTLWTKDGYYITDGL